MNLNEKLYNLRKQHHLSQEELAYQLNVTRQAISKWEKGDNKPDIDNLKKIAELFNVKLEYLIIDDFNDENNQKQSTKKSTLIVLTCICLVIGFILGKVSSPKQFPVEFLDSTKLVADFKIQQLNISDFNFSVIPAISNNNIKANYIFKDYNNNNTITIPAVFDGTSFNATCNNQIKYKTQYAIYIDFTINNYTKTIYLADFKIIDQSSYTSSIKFN